MNSLTAAPANRVNRLLTTWLYCTTHMELNRSGWDSNVLANKSTTLSLSASEGVIGFQPDYFLKHLKPCKIQQQTLASVNSKWEVCVCGERSWLATLLTKLNLRNKIGLVPVSSWWVVGWEASRKSHDCRKGWEVNNRSWKRAMTSHSCIVAKNTWEYELGWNKILPLCYYDWIWCSWCCLKAWLVPVRPEKIVSSCFTPHPPWAEDDGPFSQPAHLEITGCSRW